MYVVRLITQRRELSELAGHDDGKYAVKPPLAAVIGPAFAQVDAAAATRQLAGLIIRRS